MYLITGFVTPKILATLHYPEFVVYNCNVSAVRTLLANIIFGAFIVIHQFASVDNINSTIHMLNYIYTLFYLFFYIMCK